MISGEFLRQPWRNGKNLRITFFSRQANHSNDSNDSNGNMSLIATLMRFWQRPQQWLRPALLLHRLRNLSSPDDDPVSFWNSANLT
jgi:hypothetical protein